MLLLAVSGLSQPAPYQAKVTAVADGNTLSISTGNAQDEEIRLDGVDAPEKGQEFWIESRKALSSLIGKTVIVAETGVDLQGGVTANVYLGATWVNAYTVLNGYAWTHGKYVDNLTLILLQDTAKNSRLGLWADPSPTPPWEWRDAKPKAERPADVTDANLDRAAPAPPAAPAVRHDDGGTQGTLTHWITNSSGIRHNSSCRYFRNSKGRMCGPSEGVPCKLCGG